MTDEQTNAPRNVQGDPNGGTPLGAPQSYRQEGPQLNANAQNRQAGPQPVYGYAPRPLPSAQPGIPLSPNPMQQIQVDRTKGSAAKGFAIAGFILALIGLFVVVWQYNKYLSPFGTVGLVMSAVGLLIPEKGEERSRITYIFSVVGIIISILALIATLIIGIFNLQPFTY
ncbi:MAG: hypothetical protein ABF792_05920 [Bifidobacterium psychraerophilum]|uniref:hypothetical protein n=1 Tax=Bifidobacterium psychraerophilum TaxID=218140 RepID=UPI0039EC4145